DARRLTAGALARTPGTALRASRPGPEGASATVVVALATRRVLGQADDIALGGSARGMLDPANPRDDACGLGGRAARGWDGRQEDEVLAGRLGEHERIAAQG